MGVEVNMPTRTRAHKHNNTAIEDVPGWVLKGLPLSIDVGQMTYYATRNRRLHYADDSALPPSTSGGLTGYA